MVGYAAHMFIRGLPLITAILPLVGINIAYWVGVEHGNLPSCIPYFDGCTSISATGRYPPGDRLFRAVMLPHSAWLVLTWYFAAHWLRSVKPGTRADRTILVAGVVGAIALIIYISYLASNDPFYEVMRRYGIYFYFLGTAVAQLALTLALGRSRLQRAMFWIIVTPFCLGLFNFAQKAVMSPLNNFENRIEWVSAVLMQVWFVLLYLAWRRSRFDLLVRPD
jgi:hypothetical protein